MPDLGDGSEYVTGFDDRTAPVTAADAQQANTSFFGTAATVAGYIPWTASNLVDNVLTSLPGSRSVAGLEKGDVNLATSRMFQAIGMPGAQKFYEQNKEGLDVSSGVAGVIGAELVARRFVTPATGLMGMLREVPYARRIAALDEQYAASLATVRNVDAALASRGTLGAAQYTAVANVDKAVFDAATGQLVNTTANLSRAKAANTAKFFGFGVGVRNEAATQAILATTMNQNGFLYDDSMSYNLAFAGLGLGIGGALEFLHAGYAIRKMANSDTVRRAFSGALDPEAIESKRLGWGQRIFNREELQPGDFLGGTYADQATAGFVQAANLKHLPATNTDDAVTLLSNRDALATQVTDQARDSLQKITTKGITSDGQTRFSLAAQGYGNHADLLWKNDPGAFTGAEMVGGIPESKSSQAIVDNHMARTQTRIASVEKDIEELSLKSTQGRLTQKQAENLKNLQTLRLRLQYEMQLVPMGAVDGELVTMSELKAFEGFQEPTIRATQMGGDPEDGIATRIWEVEHENPKFKASLDNQLTLHLPSGKTMDTADHYEVLRAYRLAQNMIDSTSRTKAVINLPKNPHWFQLDMAEELMRRSDGQVQIMWPTGLDRDKAQVESLLQKTRLLKKNFQDEAGLGDKASLLRLRYNLPRLTSYEKGVLGTEDHPIEFLMRGIDSYGVDQARNLTVNDLKEGIAQSRRLQDVAPVTNRDINSLYGNSFNFMRDDKGNPLKPLLVYKRPFQQQDWNVDTLAERLAARKMRTVTTLVSNPNAVLTKEFTESIINSNDFNLASRTDQLMETHIQGSFVGAAPQTPAGAIPKSFVTTEWMGRDSPEILAAGRLRDTSGRIMRDYMKTAVDTAFGDTLPLLANPRNGQSNLLLNQFFSFRGNWDIDKDIVDKGDGFFSFKLGDTQKNRDLWKATFDSEFTPGSSLTSPQGREVVLDQLGVQALQAYNKVSDQLLTETNQLLKSYGRGEVKKANHFVPPPNTDGKFIGFVFGPDGKTIPNLTVVEETAKGFADAKAEVLQQMKDRGLDSMGYMFHTQDEVANYASIWDRAEMRFLNPGTTAVRPGKRGANKLIGPSIKMNAFESALEYLRGQYLKHGSDLLETLMKEQINSAKARSTISAEVSRNASAKDKYRSVYDYYLENLLGSSKLNSAGSVLGPVYRSVEGTADKLLAQATPSASAVWDATTTLLRKANPFDRSGTARKDFQALSDKLGPYMPFDSAVQLMEKRARGTTPPTLAGITGSINKVTATVMLRAFELAHPIMNLSGVINSMPSVIRSFQRQASESVEDYAKRVGWAANTFAANGTDVSVPDMVKIGSRAFKRAWSKEAHADYDFMVKRGYLTQEVAEFQRQFGSIETHGDLYNFGKKAVDWVSMMSDRSEDFSRSWGHMIGLEVADLQGVVGRESRHQFAHDIANKMIANYDPLNRPEVFQGALGAPLGLFQSFAQNYYQRLFRYVETKDLRSFATQYAMQSSLFGVTGLTGWDQANAFLHKFTDGEDDATTGLHERIPGTLGNILANGVISNIPAMFGGEGVDLYSRGDTSFRVPGVGDQSLPGVALASAVWNGVNSGLQAFWSDHSTLTRTQLAEVASNMVVNRPLAGMIEEFLAHGNDTDAYGQLVTDTKTNAEFAYRLLGLRSQRQSMERQAFYADKNSQEYQAAAQDILRTSTRSAIREGRTDKIPEIYQRYIDTGGDPRRFRTWLKENFQAATTPRAERQLKKLMRSKNPDMDRIANYMDMGVGVDDDESVGQGNPYGYGTDELDQDTSGYGQYGGQTTLDPSSPLLQPQEDGTGLIR